jgi:hypothetical protein
MNRRDYPCEAASADGFVAQIVRYVTSGYFFYKQCRIPTHKDPRTVDHKLMGRYGIGGKKWRRERRNLRDSAGVHYLRYGPVFVIMLTKGRHDMFYADHGSDIQDIRRTALKVFGYSIRYGFSQEQRRHKVSVRLDADTYRQVKAHLLTVATWDSFRARDRMEREFERLPYQIYGPIFDQLLAIAKQVNRSRRRRGFEQVDYGCIPTKVRLKSVFVDDDEIECQDPSMNG